MNEPLNPLMPYNGGGVNQFSSPAGLPVTGGGWSPNGSAQSAPWFGGGNADFQSWLRQLMQRFQGGQGFPQFQGQGQPQLPFQGQAGGQVQAQPNALAPMQPQAGPAFARPLGTGMPMTGTVTGPGTGSGPSYGLPNQSPPGQATPLGQIFQMKQPNGTPLTGTFAPAGYGSR